LSKHKRWLAELQRTRERFQQEAEEEEEKAAERRRKFAENQARLRAEVRETIWEGDKNENGGDELTQENKYEVGDL